MKAFPFAASTAREYRRLEGITRVSIAQTLLQNFWHSLILNLTRGAEIQVWKVKTRSGFAWRIYDPHTNSVMGYSSEAEVRSWLESRYSQ